ncbi:hypothetical protein VHEMI06279 [[Torrubiella] hemipterigena]|uniref:Pyridine nucleotide-disulfide oxidoreductase family protein n=1 Tax=[Torrubiella] hemipterigena TaxID=1531966 RepID=A0A0A1T057_9HYPO|nr:hypothetical protein VHEMI06279 [[Torrubiella] hemipterigena]
MFCRAEANTRARIDTRQLYFSAYQGQIFVYVPRSVPRQRLPANPDLRLYPTPSMVAAHIDGSLDMLHPHVINHMITGFLGDEEIVVVSYDDGDVTAYYTRTIYDWISLNGSTPLPRPTGTRLTVLEEPPSFFFRSNVGKSAWGLAIHRQSHLIAVSSNRAEVTVFAPTLASPTWGDFVKAPNNKLEASVRERSANYRIVIGFGDEADNIPNISFLDDSTGEATMICAIDINGLVWFGDIWRQMEGVRHIPTPTHPLLRSEEFWPQKSRGWGILPLHDLDFKIVEDKRQLFGLIPSVSVTPPSHKCNQPVLNIHECVRAVPNNPCPVREMPLTILSATPETMNMSLAGPNILQMLSNILAQNDLNLDSEEGEENETSSATNSDMPDNDMSDVPLQQLQGPLATIPSIEGGHYMTEGQTVPGTASDEPFEHPNDDDSSTEEDDNDAAGVSLLEDEHVTSYEPDLGFEYEFEDELEEELDEDNIDVDDFSDNGHTFDAYNEYIDDNSEPMFDSVTLSRDNANQDLSDMVYIPFKGYCSPLPTDTQQLATWLQRPQETNRWPADRQTNWESLKRRYRILRTFEKDLELRSLDKSASASCAKEMAILCPDAVTFGHFQDPLLRPFFRASSRLNMLAHVPELSIVVVASQIGRVLLLTPTKLPSAEEDNGIVCLYGMRPECILPRESDELQPRKARRPLHGMAIAPIQEEHGIRRRAMEEAAAPRRFRLMLHYRNHDILTYEITREEETDKLCIF